MKNLVVLVLLVFANLVNAESEQAKTQEAKLTLAMNEIVDLQSQVQVVQERFEFDAQAVLNRANAKLEQKLEQELDDLLTSKVNILDLQ